MIGSNPLSSVDINTDTFEAFYRNQFPRLAGSLRLVCGDPALAEEIAQEACARALNHWDRLEHFERPEGWLYRTGFNLLRRAWQRSKRGEAPLIGPLTSKDIDPTRIDLVRLLGQLPYRQRQALVFRYVLDYSTDEAAVALGVRPGALRMTLHRAVTTIRQTTGIALEESE